MSMIYRISYSLSVAMRGRVLCNYAVDALPLLPIPFLDVEPSFLGLRLRVTARIYIYNKRSKARVIND